MFDSFASWEELLAFIERGEQLYYHAPLDYSPVAVRVEKVFKNGDVRICPPNKEADPFTADRAHLNRMRYRKKVT